MVAPTLESPISAGSKPIFAIEGSSFSIFQDLYSPLSGEKEVETFFVSRNKKHLTERGDEGRGISFKGAVDYSAQGSRTFRVYIYFRFDLASGSSSGRSGLRFWPPWELPPLDYLSTVAAFFQDLQD